MPKSRGILMAKAPIPGFVKTRLADFLNPEQAAELYSCCLQDIADCVRDSGLELHVAYTPSDRSRRLRELLPSAVELFAQAGEDLGQRMANAVKHIYHTKKTGAIIIGGDIPCLQPDHLREAAAMLKKRMFVLDRLGTEGII